MKKVMVMFAMFYLLQAKDVYHIPKGEEVEQDLSLIGESALIEGKVKGDIAIVNGVLELYGEIDGDVAVVGGDVNLYSNSKIEGDVAVVGGKVHKEEGAIVKGDVAQVSLGPLNFLFKLIPSGTKGIKKIPEKGNFKLKVHKKRFNPFGAIFVLIWGISLSLLILIIGLVMPGSLENMSAFIEKKMGYSFLAGFLVEILFVPAIILLVISILGIPIIPLFILAFIIALLLSLAPSSLFTGKILKKNLEFLPDTPYILSPVGLFLVFLVWFLGSLLNIGYSIINIFSSVITLIAIFILYLYFTFGLGSIILSRLGTRKP